MINKTVAARFSNHRILDEKYASDHRPLYVEINIK